MKEQSDAERREYLIRFIENYLRMEKQFDAEERELLITFIENHTEGNKVKEDLTLLSDKELQQRMLIILAALKK